MRARGGGHRPTPGTRLVARTFARVPRTESVRRRAQKPVRTLLAYCLQRADGTDPARLHALETLYVALQAVFQRKFHADMASAFAAVWGMEEADAFFAALLGRVNGLVASERTPAPALDAALRVLLALATRLKIHQNIFFDVFRVHGALQVVLEVRA